MSMDFLTALVLSSLSNFGPGECVSSWNESILRLEAHQKSQLRRLQEQGWRWLGTSLWEMKLAGEVSSNTQEIEMEMRMKRDVKKESIDGILLIFISLWYPLPNLFDFPFQEMPWHIFFAHHQHELRSRTTGSDTESMCPQSRLDHAYKRQLIPASHA